MKKNKYETIVVETTGKIIKVLLNRPKFRNAINNKMLSEITAVIEDAVENNKVHCIVITGGNDYFAAGADVKEMVKLDAIGIYTSERQSYWSAIRQCPIPIIAAVNGYALGGGNELAMHADIIIAGDSAVFGQPEINLGIFPGAGGTQRLIRAVGKSTAMQMILTGEFIDSDTALNSGLVSEVTIPERTIERALELANIIATKSPLAIRFAKELLLQSFESSLETGLNLERKFFSLLAASEDRNEGINAFLEKRAPEFKGK